MDIAKFEGLDVGFEDHGIFVIFGGVDYLEGGHQGLGYSASMELIQKIIVAAGVTKLQEANGCMVFVEHDNSHISRIISLDNKKELDLKALGKVKK